MKTTVSTKYQIVIPRDVRRQVGIRPGQKMDIRAAKDGSVVLSKDPVVDFEAHIQKYAGSLKTSETAWGKAGLDATKWLRRQRDEEWD